jgi:hypothetical protein
VYPKCNGGKIFAAVARGIDRRDEPTPGCATIGSDIAVRS